MKIKKIFTIKEVNEIDKKTHDFLKLRFSKNKEMSFEDLFYSTVRKIRKGARQ